MDDKTVKHANAIFEASKITLLKERESDIARDKAKFSVGSGPSYARLEAIKNSYYEKLMRARLQSFREAVDAAGIQATLEDASRAWEAVEALYHSLVAIDTHEYVNYTLRAAPTSAEVVRQMAYTNSGIPRSRDRILAEYKLWRAEIENKRPKKEETWQSYYQKLWLEFGLKFRDRWVMKATLALLGIGVGYLISRKIPDWTALESSTVVAVTGAYIITVIDLFTSPWSLHSKPTTERPYFFGVIAVLFLIGWPLYWILPRLRPRNEYAFSRNDSAYISVTNASSAFRTLRDVNPKCFVKIIAPPENMQNATALYSITSNFCYAEMPDIEGEPLAEILKGSNKDSITVHVPKEPVNRSDFIVELSNVYEVKRSNEMPEKSPPDLVLIQFGEGNPWRKQ